MFFFCLWPFKTSHLRSVCLFPFFLHPLSFVLYKGGPPKQISNDEAGWSSNYIEATRQIPPAPSPPPPHKKKNQQSLTVRNEKTYFSRRLAPKVAKKSDLRAANVL